MDPVLNDNYFLKENDDSEFLNVSSLILLWLKSIGVLFHWILCESNEAPGE